MGIRRRILRRPKLLIHQHGITLGDRPPYPFPNVMIPYDWGSNHNFKVHKLYGSKRVYIGHVFPLHKPRYIRHPGVKHRDNVPWYPLKEVKPRSGPVGFLVWVSTVPTYCQSDGDNKFSWWGLDHRGKRLICHARHTEFGHWRPELVDGEIEHEFLGSFLASDAQQEAYWEHDVGIRWPDWLHHLEKKAHVALYQEAEKKFGLKMPWGLFKGQFL